jgi:hypothetical protein
VQKSCRKTLRTFKILIHMPLARQERRAGELPAKFRRGGWRGVEKDWSTRTRSSRRIHGWAWEEEGMAGGVVPTVAEAAAEGSSSARGFPTRRMVKIGLDSCSRTRGSFWGGRFGRRRGGGTGSTATGAYQRGGNQRRGSFGLGPATGGGLGASVR